MTGPVRDLADHEVPDGLVDDVAVHLVARLTQSSVPKARCAVETSSATSVHMLAAPMITCTP